MVPGSGSVMNSTNSSEWWSSSTRRLGIASALTIAVVGVLYLVVIISWLLIEASPSDPIGDPYLAAMEVLTIISAFAVVGFAISVLCFVGVRNRLLAAGALISALLAAGLTTTVHFVQLTAVRQLWRFGDISDYRLVWPSLIFAVEYFAWDILIGLFMVFTGWALSRAQDHSSGHRAFITGGVLCLIGVVGPISGQMLLQNVAVLGYAVFLPLAAFLASSMFKSSTIS